MTLRALLRMAHERWGVLAKAPHIKLERERGRLRWLTAEEAERRYMESGLVAHRKSLAYTGRDLSKQVIANLVGSPDLLREKVAGLEKIGVDHACALLIPADSMAEFEDQVEWFAKTVL